MINIAEIRNPYVVAAIAVLQRTEPITIEEVRAAVSSVCDIAEDVICQRRNRRYHVIIARHLAWKILCDYGHKITLSKIGLAFGGYDHTSVMHGARIIGDRIETDETIARLHQRVLNKLRLKTA